MELLTNAIIRLPEYRVVSNALAEGRVPACATGISGVHKAHIISALCEEHGRKAVVVVGDEAEAQRMAEDLQALGLSACFYPYRDFGVRDVDTYSREYEHQRLGVLSRMLSGSYDVVLCCIDAALQYTIPPKELRKRISSFRAGDTAAPEKLTRMLFEAGYERAEQVESPGQFAVRGGIFDFFPPGEAFPIRLEFWGDEIDTISYFDPESQRRTEQVERVVISPSTEVPIGEPGVLAEKIRKISSSLRGKAAAAAKEILNKEIGKLEQGIRPGSADKFISLIYEERSCLLDYAAEGYFLFVSEFSRVKERSRSSAWQNGEDLKAFLEEGVLCKGLDTFSYDWVDWLSFLEKIPSVYMETFAHSGFETPIRVLTNFTARQLSVWSGGMQFLLEDLDAVLSRGWACVVMAGTQKAVDSLVSDLQEQGIRAARYQGEKAPVPGEVLVLEGGLSAGMEYPGTGFTLLTHGRTAQQQKKRRVPKQGKNIQSLSELSVGDLVVHSIHGIGVFEGIHKIEMQGIVKDYIKIRYAKQDILYVPVTQLDMVAKYIGAHEDSQVKLHRLGGTEWQKAKARVRSAVKDIAQELIRLYAERMKAPGHAFPEDTEWQKDFESHFEFSETEDQLRCIEEIKGDMMSTAPMDRLLCGDVGFGKTEVALRAAFKCITDSMQCALLVPTTILAWQHYQTILRRMEGFPVRIGLLSRFRTPKQQEETIAALRRGEIDMVVGTHRLVQKDVKFKNLGLVIIDEEQRFGVAQKEKLKDMCKNVDVLTLSATPIPRTLNMAMSGIRDMSVIEEAPQDRHPVQTYVMEHDNGIIYDAVRKELRRGGQVYYLHNRVETIERVAARIQASIPECTVGIAHGKMGEEELSEVWRKLLEHEIDVLVCTTIIETGIDVPNCNTLIIENADHMGLSQLHQLRGRVGRSSRRAYAYLTFTRGKVLTEVSEKRLSAIREFTEFGSGFRIAMRDLEIRGAGNVLGAQQHGHMESVGYDMYLKLLGEAISAEKGKKDPLKETDCLVDLQIQAHIPEDYIENPRQRLDIYHRIADIRNQEDASDVLDELIDRFGDPPPAVKGLVDVALLRNLAAGLGIFEIKQNNGSLLLFQDTIDKEQISRLVGAMKGRVMVSAGAKPYISLKLQKPVLEELGQILSIMSGKQED